MLAAEVTEAAKALSSATGLIQDEGLDDVVESRTRDAEAVA
jgi:hypothetical protein